ncbi:MAG: hypothetical protein L3K00_00420 [Thermoplasmata archaeon]|nr:hypothetical protein [Thermoplasmata archaeon]
MALSVREAPSSTDLGSSFLLRVASSGKPPCSSLETNASLLAWYAEVYDGLPANAQTGGIGGNGSFEEGQTSYVNGSAGGASLVSAWTAICQSPTYVALWDQFGLNSTYSGSALGTNGLFYESFGFDYWASCSSSTNYSSATCQWITNWNVNMSSGHASGPSTTQDLAFPGGYPDGSEPVGYSTNSVPPNPPEHTARGYGPLAVPVPGSGPALPFATIVLVLLGAVVVLGLMRVRSPPAS